VHEDTGACHRQQRAPPRCQPVRPTRIVYARRRLQEWVRLWQVAPRA
jgi:hypothetical protein